MKKIETQNPIAVAIVMALVQYRKEQLRDDIPMKLTIKRSQSFSPWSSKVSMLREKPNLLIF